MKTGTVKILFWYEGLKHPWNVIYPNLRSTRHFLISCTKISLYRILVHWVSAGALAREFNGFNYCGLNLEDVMISPPQKQDKSEIVKDSSCFHQQQEEILFLLNEVLSYCRMCNVWGCAKRRRRRMLWIEKVRNSV